MPSSCLLSFTLSQRRGWPRSVKRSGTWRRCKSDLLQFPRLTFKDGLGAKSGRLSTSEHLFTTSCYTSSIYPLYYIPFLPILLIINAINCQSSWSVQKTKWRKVDELEEAFLFQAFCSLLPCQLVVLPQLKPGKLMFFLADLKVDLKPVCKKCYEKYPRSIRCDQEHLVYTIHYALYR